MAAGSSASALALGPGYFEIHYRLSSGNSRQNGVYNIPITITDSAGNQSVIFAALTLQSNSAAIPSPNPYLHGTAFVPSDFTTGIVFRPVEPGGVVEIYNLRGVLVAHVSANSNPYIHWNVTDLKGAAVASGYYFYIVRNPSGSMFRGKLAVIR